MSKQLMLSSTNPTPHSPLVNNRIKLLMVETRFGYNWITVSKRLTLTKLLGYNWITISMRLTLILTKLINFNINDIVPKGLKG